MLSTALFISGCGLFPKSKDETAGWSAQRLYSEAKDNLNDGNYERAIQLSGKRVTSSFKAWKASRAARGSRSLRS